jgi:hypothetical protein
MTWLYAIYHIAALAVIVIGAVRMHNRMYGDDQQ